MYFLRLNLQKWMEKIKRQASFSFAQSKTESNKKTKIIPSQYYHNETKQDIIS